MAIYGPGHVSGKTSNQKKNKVSGEQGAAPFQSQKRGATRAANAFEEAHLAPSRLRNGGGAANGAGKHVAWSCWRAHREGFGR